MIPSPTATPSTVSSSQGRKLEVPAVIDISSGDEASLSVTYKVAGGPGSSSSRNGACLIAPEQAAMRDSIC